MKTTVTLVGLVTIFLGFMGSKSQANTVEDHATYELAQGCYSIQSPTTGKFVRRIHNGGLIDGGLSYDINGIGLSGADAFYLKPTKFKQFLLHDRAGRYFSAHFPLQMSSGPNAEVDSEWKIEAIQDGSGSFIYKLLNLGLGRYLRHATWDGGLFYSRLVNGEQAFKLIPAQGCREFPEAQLGLNRTDVIEDHPAPGEFIKGFADFHTHMTSYEFMGGKFLHGRPFHPYGIEHALPDGSGIHGPWGALDIIGNLMGENDINARHDTRGWPDFPSWPKHSTVSHQQAYYKWIERAHKAGLKVMVSHLVENEVLCWAHSTINPASWIKRNGCNTMDSVRLQSNSLVDMQDYIDAQAGGPGKGFFRIVRSSNEARQVISQGKLAVLMGIEVSELLNCGLQDNPCTKPKVDRVLDEVYNFGVRTMFPIHRFDNQFGGTRIEDGFINVGQAIASGRFFETKECLAGVEGQNMTNGFPLIGKVPVLKDILAGLGLQPEYDEDRRHCNKHGLTELGVYLINGMIDRGMLIELDHSSYETSDAILKIAEARNYSGVISAHSHLQRADGHEPSDLHERIAKLGGGLAVYNSDNNGLATDLNKMIDVKARHNYLVATGIGTDVNGLGAQAGVRSNIADSPVEYPFTSFDGLYTFDEQTTGNRTFNYNNEGIAHYGLLADQMEDLKKSGDWRVYDAIYDSAEAYLRMWKRAESNADTQYINPLPQEPFSIVDHRSGKCFDIPGNDNNVGRNVNIQLWWCDKNANDQKWIYKPKSGKLHNYANQNYCLDYEGWQANGSPVKLWDCAGVPNQHQAIDFVGSTIRPRGNLDFAIDANGWHDSANITLWWHHGGSNQQWTRKSN